MMFTDRRQAGRMLGKELERFRSLDPVVLGLPRGGVPVAAEVARALQAPLDVIVVRKLGVPLHPEFAMGAIGEGDVCYIDWDVVSKLGLSGRELALTVRRERAELASRVRRVRAGRPQLDLTGRTVILVDDGIATGSTVTAAIRVARDLGAGRIVVATPVAPDDTIRSLLRIADEVVVLESPQPFYAVGEAYLAFGQTSDNDVQQILKAHADVQGDVLERTA
jgi:putative phosphoribosyl transferase